MNVYAISDLHLPGGNLKPMDIFGPHWANHFARVEADWRARVRDGDVVLLPGDTCWAMQLSGALEDLAAIGALPGRKVLLRGNHDYWWSSISRVRSALPEGMAALQHDAVRFGDAVICGARGWLCPGSAPLPAEDAKIYARELVRLSLSLAAADKLCGQGPVWRIAMLHYPPFADKDQPTEVTALLSRYGVADAVYGHLHGAGLTGAFAGEMDGVRYHQVSCDGLGFSLYRLQRRNASA
ncbi:MAG: metallophosphoesterase [Firmicutes bacterium]|nr:metallophosphoesterase [Bacillota bacterium]